MSSLEGCQDLSSWSHSGIPNTPCHGVSVTYVALTFILFVNFRYSRPTLIYVGFILLVLTKSQLSHLSNRQ